MNESDDLNEDDDSLDDGDNDVDDTDEEKVNETISFHINVVDDDDDEITLVQTLLFLP